MLLDLLRDQETRSRERSPSPYDRTVTWRRPAPTAPSPGASCATTRSRPNRRFAAYSRQSADDCRARSRPVLTTQGLESGGPPCTSTAFRQRFLGHGLATASARVPRSGLRRLGQPAATGRHLTICSKRTESCAQRTGLGGCASPTTRRRLAVKGKVLGRRRLAGLAGIVTPDTILRWYRTLVAKNQYRLYPTTPAPKAIPPIASLSSLGSSRFETRRIDFSAATARIVVCARSNRAGHPVDLARTIGWKVGNPQPCVVTLDLGGLHGRDDRRAARASTRSQPPCWPCGGASAPVARGPGIAHVARVAVHPSDLKPAGTSRASTG